ncbi:MAG TPA: cyclic nucleotide-binding domain-containing protein [Myxococcales bacterium]|jgi:CRP-like cAMP-binding protein
MIAFSKSDRFAVLDERDRDRLEALAKLDEFDDGEEVAASGRPSEWLSLIVSGGVDLRGKGRSGGEITLAHLQPGDIFGELETFADLPDGVRHVARGKTVVRAIDKHVLKHELKVHRSLASGILAVYCRSISEKVRAANEILSQERLSDPLLPPAERPPHLSVEEVAWLSVLGHAVEAADGEAVVREGDTTRSFYVVKKGALEVRKKAAAGEDRTLATLGPLDVFGIMAFVDGKPRSASVVARSAVHLARVESDVLDKAAQLNFTVSFKFLGTLCSVLGRTYRDTVHSIAG